MMRSFIVCVLCLFVIPTYSQTCEDFAVEISARVRVSPPAITLTWKKLSDTTSYSISRKGKNELTWTSYLAYLSTNDSTFTDTSVSADSSYEYQIISYHYSGSTSWLASGYILAGIATAPTHCKGAVVLLVDSLISDSIASAIHTYMKDMSGDGWQVVRHIIPTYYNDTMVKRLIITDYHAIPNLKAVQIVGHVAVPYSGDINPDGHSNHLGAWPADVFYAQLSHPFTDYRVNDVTASFAANQNRPGDGKWDQDTLTGISELQVARIDLSNMPAFATSEASLVNNYFARDHNYKMGLLDIRRRALIQDDFGVFSTYYAGSWYYEAFASCGWRSFAPLVSHDSIAALPYVASLNHGSYQWSYGCGGGNFTSASGIGTTDSFATNHVNGIFTMLFGSYFGDWNVQNDFLRAPLCSPVPALTNCWAGRPYWYFHQIALGENIGYCAWLSQNNDGNLYFPVNIYGIQRWVHQALMGDLTLRSDYIRQASGLTVDASSRNGAYLSWSASPDTTVTGYYVYRSDSDEFGAYTLLSPTPLTTRSFYDSDGFAGLKYYMVRPVKLQNTPSGAYFNLGVGITDSATVNYVVSVALSGNDTICSGTYHTFAANTQHIHYPHFTWIKNGITVGADSSHFTTHSLFAGDQISCRVTDFGGLSLNSDTINMYVFDSITAGAISGRSSMCRGDTVTFSAASPGGTWHTSAVGIATVDVSGGLVRAASAGTANISYSVANRCFSAFAAFPISVTAPAFAGGIAGTSALCPGGTATCTAPYSSGSGRWSSSNLPVATINSSGNVLAITPGRSTIRYDISNICGADSSFMRVTVGSLPDAGTITGPTDVCPGDSIILTDISSGGYWSMTNSLATIRGGVIVGVAAGLDSAVYTVTNTCGTARARYIVNIHPVLVPSLSIRPFPGDTLCQGDSLSWQISSLNSGATPTFQWYRFGSVIGTGYPFSYLPTLGDVISCSMTSNAVCASPATTTSNPVRLEVVPEMNPRVRISTSIHDTISFLGQLVTFNTELTDCGRNPGFQWYQEGNPVIGATSHSFTTTAYGNQKIFCIMNCDVPCATRLTDTSNLITVVGDYLLPNRITSINSGSLHLSVSPNPNSGRFNLSGTLEHMQSETYTLEIIDLSGRNIYQSAGTTYDGKISELVELNTSTTVINVGYYMLKVVTKSSAEVLPFIVEK